MLVEVVYALPDRQLLIEIEMQPPYTVSEAISQSNIMQRFPEIDLTSNKVGIFSRLVTLDDEVRAGDRVEIYRPLLADPKELRRKKVEEKKQSQAK